MDQRLTCKTKKGGPETDSQAYIYICIYTKFFWRAGKVVKGCTKERVLFTIESLLLEARPEQLYVLAPGTYCAKLDLQQHSSAGACCIEVDVLLTTQKHRKKERPKSVGAPTLLTFPKDPAVLKALRRLIHCRRINFLFVEISCEFFPRQTRCFRDPAAVFYYCRIFLPPP